MGKDNYHYCTACKAVHVQMSAAPPCTHTKKNGNRTGDLMHLATLFKFHG